MIQKLLSKQTKASIILLAFCCALSLNWFSHSSWNAQAAETEGDAKPDIKLYMALADEHNVPLRSAKDSFECTEKIYSVVELSHYEKAKYMLTVLWTDPEGNERERTEYPFFVRHDTTRLWSWLQLSRATGAGMLQWINPAAGLEEFIGEWKVEILINGKPKASTDFTVLC